MSYETPVDVRGELRELESAFLAIADRYPKLRIAFVLNDQGQVLLLSIGLPPDASDDQIIVQGVPESDRDAVRQLSALCRRAGLVLLRCQPLFPQPDDAAVRELLRTDDTPENHWLGFLCYKMRPDLSCRTTEENGKKITRAWFDHFASTSAHAVRWLVNRWLSYSATASGVPSPTASREETAPDEFMHEDGPDRTRERFFWWRGNDFMIAPTSWKLSLPLWESNKVDFATVGESVWGNDGVPPGTIKSRLSTLNRELADHQIPVSWSMIGQTIVRNPSSQG